MLIRDDGGTWTAITQPAHAHLAGQVVRAWAPQVSEDVALAVEQHDVPWTEWDRTPPLHEGRPAAFFEAPLEPRLRIWGGVADRLVAQNPYAALLVSLHATNIHTRYMAPDAQPQAFLAQQRRDQDALLEVLPGATREQAERDADLLFAIDALSLTLCHDWDARELPPVDGTLITLAPAGGGVYTMNPWPLRVDGLTVGVHARTLSERFQDEAALHRALAAAPNERRTWRLQPA